ncbi:hypothetical protein [Aquiflexum sp.]|uniref:hypothetical protein n=1 Tax=Aquiflexum sp. TaxID=1872584 RepID=UPI0035934B46
MAEYLFQGDYKSKADEVKVNLFLIHFKDENNVHFIYSPHLDLTGYGENLNDAKKSFEIVFEDFLDYTIRKKTLGKLLTELGWELKGTLKKPKKILAPSITSVISQNEYVSEIFDKYPVNTFHQEVGIPAFA